MLKPLHYLFILLLLSQTSGFAQTLMVNPASASQGEQLSITVTSTSNTFATGTGTIQGWLINAPTDTIVLSSISVSNDTLLSGQISVDLQQKTGMYKIEIDNSSTITKTENAFEVLSNSPGNQGCLDAMQIMDTGFYPIDSTNHTHYFKPDCFLSPVRSETWFTFTASDTKLFSWFAEPHNANGELDWALYDITHGCPQDDSTMIDSSILLGCNYNYSGANGERIGMDYTSTTNCPNSDVSHEAAKEFCPSVMIDSGRVYALLIDNFMVDGSGFDLTMGENYTDTSNTTSPMTNLVISPDTGEQGELLSISVTSTQDCFLQGTSSIQGVLIGANNDTIPLYNIYEATSNYMVANLNINANQSPGYYALQILDGQGNELCSQDSAFMVTLVTGVPAVAGSDGFSIYPNPAHSFVIVKSTQYPIQEIVLYDVSGRAVLRQKASTFKHRVDLNNLPNSSYLIEVVDIQGNRIYDRVILQR